MKNDLKLWFGLGLGTFSLGTIKELMVTLINSVTSNYF